MNKTQKKIAVYGGSFNPPHLGHTMIVSWLLWSGIVDMVIILPVYAHAFDGIHDKKLAPFEKRVLWSKVAFADCLNSKKNEIVIISELEKELPTPSYTIDSLQALQKQYPQSQLRLVIGSDSIPHLPQWKNWSEIEAHFSPIVVGRVGYPCESEVFFPDISSTDIRQKLKEGIIPHQWIHKALSELLCHDNPYENRKDIT
jgi:nicotinate-nucleotide adenylyltransferase